MDKLKAIFFDADGTIVDHKECEKQALVYLFDSIGIGYQDEYQDIFRPLDHMLWDSGSCDGISVSAKDIPTYRFKLLFEKLNISYDNYAKANDLFKVGLANSVALIENADEIIEYLYNKGYMLCVVTNGLIELQKPRVANSKIGKFISHIMVSEEVGAHKPNPLIFNTLLKRIGLNPWDVIMIGDSLKNDIQGAKNAKIKAVWYNPEHSKNETDILPDYEINNLLQLKDMF
ncbi:MAG: YjjG family noncanonical pyrimidine nucleotidase [Oscillospiraceae bacterium]|nr:YjjG family noncanonical pyrimidine nucleotidase [Oscillospiraceae bacterium]